MAERVVAAYGRSRATSDDDDDDDDSSVTIIQ